MGRLPLRRTEAAPHLSHARTVIGSAPITALDGHQIGSLDVVEKVEVDFTDLDRGNAGPHRRDGVGRHRTSAALLRAQVIRPDAPG